MNLPIALSTNGSKAASSSWLQQSVQAFFGGVNWEDHPPELQEIKLSASQDSTTGLSMTLSVDQFFAAVNWDDAQIAASSLSEASVSPVSDELTLDDFSNLFQ